MIQLWKNLRVNLMYWRFRHVTRNRLRLQAWLRQRRPPPRLGYRPRGSARVVRYHNAQRTWAIFIALVVVLTALQILGARSEINGTLVWGLSVVAVIAALYAALQSV